MRGMRTLFGLEYSEVQGYERFLRGCTVAVAARKRSSTMCLLSIVNAQSIKSNWARSIGYFCQASAYLSHR